MEEAEGKKRRTRRRMRRSTRRRGKRYTQAARYGEGKLMGKNKATINRIKVTQQKYGMRASA